MIKSDTEEYTYYKYWRVIEGCSTQYRRLKGVQQEYYDKYTGRWIKLHNTSKLSPTIFPEVMEEEVNSYIMLWELKK